jgi:pyruvate kinase
MSTATMPNDDLEKLGEEVRGLRDLLLAEEARRSDLLQPVEARYRESARNFIHYLTLRTRDLRPLQLELWRRGLSSLGRLESHVLDSLIQVADRLDEAMGRPREAASAPCVSWDEGEGLLHRHTRELLGPRPRDRHVMIMVTAPSADQVDDVWVDRLLSAGMNLLRINAAHEDETAWERMVRTARRVAERRQVPLKIVVDLPGPKLRTVALGEATRVLKLRPERDELGRVTVPAQVPLAPSSQRRALEAWTLRVPDEVWAKLAAGDSLHLRDARGRERELRVVARRHRAGTATLERSAYLVPDTEIVAEHERDPIGKWRVEDVPSRAYGVPVAIGDLLRLARPGTVPDGSLPAIGCSMEEALRAVRPGQRVLFDDGLVESVVESVDAECALLRITFADEGGAKLKEEKGINLPETELDLPAFSPEDERALAFAAAHADIVEMSFVRSAADVRELHRRLGALPAKELGVVLKIETRSAFTQLPGILLAGMARYPVGVMIARGDLAIETGYVRLAELQEEILWLCEAAHVPVVWATQVLDNLARTGRPSRAEVTDAAMAVRAECAMLNKGPYVVEAVRVLDDIIRRMEQHQYKKRSLYRKLSVALPKP